MHKKWRHIVAGLLTLCGLTSCVQPPLFVNKAKTENPQFHQKLERLLRFSVPTMEVSELHKIQEEVYIFDTRKRPEYLVSHLPNARFLNYPTIDTSVLQGVLPTDTIVLYCSVGYRSERIGEVLREKGFLHVYNLYGSIFEWANQGYPIVDQHGLPTRRIHTFNRRWSKWVNPQDVESVW